MDVHRLHGAPRGEADGDLLVEDGQRLAQHAGLRLAAGRPARGEQRARLPHVLRGVRRHTRDQHRPQQERALRAHQELAR